MNYLDEEIDKLEDAFDLVMLQESGFTVDSQYLKISVPFSCDAL